MGKRDREIPDGSNEVKVPGGIMKIRWEMEENA